MTKSILKVQYEYPFEVAGILSSVRDYRLCHFLNSVLQMNFRRENDLSLVINKQGDISTFTLFVDATSDTEKHLLLSNKGNNNWFFPEIKNIDYIYIVQGPDKWFKMDDLLGKLRQVEVVNGAYEVVYEKFKSKENLLFLS